MARKILLADDSVTAQNMGRKILADAGYEVITVNNGSAALKKISEQKPDVIVLDVYMPGYSGLEVCQRLKETQETSRLPVLLTVGKLEPFKPEEAKRARADAFIVKPFEASELLSALSKLEDKIVPAGQSSKPGRFARVTASLDEGKYDKSMSFEEDAGWKNRIAFPSKEKDRDKTRESEEATANAGNRDLHTVIERKLAEPSQAPKAQDAKVDLGALAPEGLPKDVTPEEIAALAAAAAQVKGRLSDDKGKEQLAAEVTKPAPALPVPLEVPVHAFNKEKFEEQPPEKIEASETKSSDTELEAASLAANLPEIVAPVGETNPVDLPVASVPEPAPPAGDNAPVTIAMGGTPEAGESSRWTAVSVPLDGDEAAISLEQEMQKAYASYAAAEIATASEPTIPPSIAAVEAAATTSSTTPEAALPEPPLSIPATPAPEAAQSLSEIANKSTEVLRAAVQELETVAESYAGEAPTMPQPEPVPFPLPEAEIAAETAIPEPVEEAVVKASPAVEQQQEVQETPKIESLTAPIESLPAPEVAKTEEEKKEFPVCEPTLEESSEAGNERWQPPTSDHREIAAAPVVNEIPAEQISAQDAGTATAADQASSSAAQNPTKETDETATAAAWASWRRIRESADSGAKTEKSHDAEAQSAPEDLARAVAAGAEKSPEEGSADSDPAIASIVDSVLADLRPKIVEEISRKMGKKK